MHVFLAASFQSYRRIELSSMMAHRLLRWVAQPTKAVDLETSAFGFGLAFGERNIKTAVHLADRPTKFPAVGGLVGFGAMQKRAAPGGTLCHFRDATFAVELERDAWYLFKAPLVATARFELVIATKKAMQQAFGGDMVFCISDDDPATFTKPSDDVKRAEEAYKQRHQTASRDGGMFYMPRRPCALSGCDQHGPFSRCGGCKMVAYCNVAHQKAHWPVHKQECAALRVGK